FFSFFVLKQWRDSVYEENKPVSSRFSCFHIAIAMHQRYSYDEQNIHSAFRQTLRKTWNSSAVRAGGVER
ncbi:MAG: hypothetical protein KC445_21245, partial [Anaerolineales bacterium]|nr:hypothetical protein [Anaerolineales bacterium]